MSMLSSPAAGWAPSRDAPIASALGTGVLESKLSKFCCPAGDIHIPLGEPGNEERSTADISSSSRSNDGSSDWHIMEYTLPMCTCIS